MINTELQEENIHTGVAQSRQGWRKVRFGDVVRNVQVNVDPDTSGLERYVAGEHMETDNLHIRQWGTIGDGYLGPAFHRKFTKGQVLYGSRRTYLRKVALAEFDGICANTTFTLEANEDKLLPALLPFIMQSEAFTEHSIMQSRGSVNPYVNWKDLEWYEFALPPIDEQRRIAEILWAAEDVIKKTQYTLELMKAYKDILVKNSFEPDILRQSGDSFSLMTLSQILSFASDGPFGSKLKTEHYKSEGVRVIRLQNIGDGFFNDNDKAYISDKYYLTLTKYTLKPDDIVVAGLGDETHALGRACQIPEYLGVAINKADCFCLRANTSLVQQQYLLYFLNSSYARSQIDQLVQGTTRSRINVSNLKSITIPVREQEVQLHICNTLKTLEIRYLQVATNLQLEIDLAKILREHLLCNREYV